MSELTAPRLIATDLDGTIVRSDGTISERTVAALARVELAGATRAAAGDALAALASQTVGTSFGGISRGDQYNAFGGSVIPPDSMGAAGPDHFVEAVATPRPALVREASLVEPC